ncbi:MAG TPA: hypothetical protein PLH82_03930 [Candidatus Paceibacterota bacterium]|nr:hypothetical protein [Candidatus Paceibacterota bacterium]
MGKNVISKLKKLWIHSFVVILVIPCFFIGRAFAYWSGLVNPPADFIDPTESQIGSGKDLNITFNFDNIYTSSEKLIPTGCTQFVSSSSSVSETAIKDYQISWETTDTTATRTNVIIKFMNICLCDTFDNEIYTNYLSNCKVSVSQGTYSTPGDPSTFSGTTVDNYDGSTLGQMSFMLDNEEDIILRLEASIQDYSRSNTTTYAAFKTAVASSNFRVNFQYTVENPNLYKTTDIWAQFDTASVTNQDKGPYYNETNNYTYQSNLKVYEKNKRYNAGDILYDPNKTSTHYGIEKYFLVVQGNTQINLDGSPAGWIYMTWAEATNVYRSDYIYSQGDFVIIPSGVYYWNYFLNHSPGWTASAPGSSSDWTLYTTNTALNVWQKHKRYTYGDVVRWWSGSIGASQPVNNQYVSIKDINIVSDVNMWGTRPGPGDYPNQWVEVNEFKNNRSQPFDSNKAYAEGESMKYNNQYYIAVIATKAGRTPVNSPKHWKLVTFP